MRTPSRAWALATSLIVAGALAGCSSPAGDEEPTVDDGAVQDDGATDDGSMDDGATDDGSMDDGSMDDGMADAAATVTTAETDLGTILVDGNGMTLYLFLNDAPGTSVCEGQCAVNWPPLLGEATAHGDADDSLLGTLTRPDGSTQASYNGWPLYYWINDAAPGDTTGQGVNGVWYVVSPEGEAIGAS